MKAVIVIPTYNERENIVRLLPVLDSILTKNYSGDFEILVVDGNSPDGTAAAVKALSESLPSVHLLVEPEKRGLGVAYMSGFKYAMTELGADIVVEMDADFQHDPKDVPRLLQAIEDGADYAIGSRFVRGGSIPKEWSFKRKFLSIGGNYVSKLVLGIFSVNDFTSGFKASRVRGFVDKLDLDHILSKGFAYKIDLLYRMHKLGARIVEVPIAFGLRDRGDSKMESNNMLDSLRVVLLLRLRDYSSFIKFAVVGFIGFLTDTVLFVALSMILRDPSWASLISGFTAMNVTFLLNNVWSFKKHKLRSLKRILKKLPPYYVISYIPIAFRSAVLIPLAIVFYGLDRAKIQLAFLLGIFLGMLWNYVLYSKIIWRPRRNHD